MPRLRRQDPGHDSQQRRLARTVRTQEAEDRSAADLQRYVVQDARRPDEPGLRCAARRLAMLARAAGAESAFDRTVAEADAIDLQQRAHLPCRCVRAPDSRVSLRT